MFISFKAYDVVPNTEQIDDLMEWRNEEGVDFWRAGAAGKLSRVMVPPQIQKAFESFMRSRQIEYKVHIDDMEEVEKEFEADRVRRLEMKKTKSAIDPAMTPDFTVYWTTEEIDMYCRRLSEVYPQLVQREFLTYSHEFRDVFALKISSGGFGNKPLIFVVSGTANGSD